MNEIVRHLDGLRLSLHEGKSRIHRTADGITFLGWRITPEGTWMKRQSVVRMRRRFRHMHELWTAGEMEWDEIQQRVNSWIGHAQWGDTWFQQSLFQFARRAETFSRAFAAVAGNCLP